MPFMIYLNPINDIAFKRIFSNESYKNILISFLNHLLDFRENKQIVEVELLNPYQGPKLIDHKENIVDIRCCDQRGVQYIVEMQLCNSAAFIKRIQYYVAKTYSLQLNKGEDYPKLNEVIFLGILNFNVSANPHYISRHIIKEIHTHEHLFKDFSFNLVELPKFTKQLTELKDLADKWIYFLKSAAALPGIPEQLKEPPIIDAFTILERSSWTTQEFDIYEAWTFRLKDEELRLQEATEKAELKGKEEGIKIGEELGQKTTAITIATKLKQQSIAPEIISQTTGLPLETISKLPEEEY